VKTGGSGILHGTVAHPCRADERHGAEGYVNSRLGSFGLRSLERGAGRRHRESDARSFRSKTEIISIALFVRTLLPARRDSRSERYAARGRWRASALAAERRLGLCSGSAR